MVKRIHRSGAHGFALDMHGSPASMDAERRQNAYHTHTVFRIKATHALVKLQYDYNTRRLKYHYSTLLTGESTRATNVSTKLCTITHD